MSVPNPTSQRTPAQVIFIHTAESIGLSALLTLVVAAVQYVSLHGFNFTGLGAVLGTSFVAQMAMVYKSLNNPNTLQAAEDTEKQLEPALLQAVPPVIINHNYPPAAVPVQAPSTASDLPTKPMPVAKANTVPKAG